MAQTIHHYSEREEWGLDEEILGQSMIETLQSKSKSCSSVSSVRGLQWLHPLAVLTTMLLFLFLLREDTVFSSRACELGLHMYCSLL